MPLKAYYEIPTHYVMELDRNRFIVVPKVTVSQDAAGATYLQGILQDYIDVRWKLDEHDVDDPVIIADPGLPYMFWDGDGTPSTTDVVYRPILCTVTWDGSGIVVQFERLVPHGG